MADQDEIVAGRGASTEAMFRYLAVCQVLTGIRSGQSQAQVIRSVASRNHPSFDGGLRRISARSLYRWCASFREQGLAGLEPASRSPAKSSLVIPDPLVAFAAAQKEQDPWVSVPEIIERAAQYGIIHPEKSIHRTTLYRVLKRTGVPVERRKQVARRDGLRFAYPHRMQMLLCDGKHFRAGASRAKRVALFFLDDATRYGLNVIVGASENALLFLQGLYSTVSQYGFFSILFMDRGPGFVALDTIEIVAKLNALLIYGARAYPEGHGKIEKFNQTALSRVLRGLDRRPDVDPAGGALTLRLRHWLKMRYNHTPHESLGKQTPHERFHNDSAPLRFPESEQDLGKRFVLYLERRVTPDHIVSVDAVPYEMPRGYAGARVKLHRSVLTSTIHFVHEGRLIELHPVDLHRNATTPRGAGPALPELEHPLPPSAADIHFSRDFQPIVGPDGGFPVPEINHKEDKKP